jgi:short-subunit dehydrogenase
MIIKNKVAIITGASGGIGLATAKLFANHGIKIALISRSRTKLEKISKVIPNSFVLVCNMTKSKEIISMVKKVHKHFGRIDILINNAGQGYDSPIEKININSFHYLFDLDVVGPLIAMQQVIPIMRKQKEGSIVNISSGTALMFLPDMAAYSSLKRALVGISLTAREELKNDNIKVSVIYPYITATDFEKNTIKDSRKIEEEQEENYNAQLPPADSSEYIAQKILSAVISGQAEICAHDWMKKMGK